MTDTIRLTPEVDAFVAAVRACFADLDVDEREELLDGLEADTADLVAERGPEALGDPEAYAAELRAAAGLPPSPGRRQWTSATPTALLDAASGQWSRLLDKLPGDVGGAVRAARPAWWVFRAWLAVMFANYTFARYAAKPDVAWLPTPSWVVGLLLVAVASVISVQIGRGAVWPGKPGLVARLVLLALNIFALLITFQVLQQVRYHIEASVLESRHYSEPVAPSGLSFNGQPLLNIYPYDAAGNPLVGVQLVDDEGRRLKIDPDSLWMTGQEDRSLTPWLNGRTPLFSVFPLPEQGRDLDTGNLLGDPTLQSPPFAVLPKVTLAGVTPTRTVPAKSEAPAKKQADAKTRP